MSKLSKKTIKERLIRWRNLERLHPIARQRIEALEKENRELKQQLASVVKTYDAIIEKMKLRIEELEQMIFGRKQKKKDKNRFGFSNSSHQGKENNQTRESSSYRRSVPKEEDITETKDYPITDCPDCGTPLKDFNLTVQYKEDIELLQNVLKTIEKQRVQSGFCPCCQKRYSGLPIQPQSVYLGESIKQFVCYCNIVLRLSFAQTRSLLCDLAKIDLSDGEITNVLDQQAKQLLPHYQNLQVHIRGQPGAHYDETGYPVQQEGQGKYAWLMTGTKTEETVFRLGQSRGKGNAEKLKGKHNQEQVGITDDYGAYRTLFKHHQLDWAHPLRKLRDLVNSDYLTQDKQEHCKEVYGLLNALHDDLKEQLETPFLPEKRKQVKQEMAERLSQIAVLGQNDPEKLKTIKQGLLKNKERYFTCLLFKDIPTTNNKAERNLRHLVLKRAISRGSKTQKGAWTMSILCSVLLSLWWRKPSNFFQEYAVLLNTA